MNSSFHVPVLSAEVIEYIISDKSGTYVDCTLGGGGHSELILNKLSGNATLIGIDQDKDAIFNAKKKLTRFKQVQLVQDNFKNLKHILIELKINQIDGLLLDLGVSSFQIDSEQRGFSYNVDSKLDMRMNQNDFLTAADILNEYSKEELTKIFFDYGEEKKSKSITNLIIKEREKERFESTFQLRQIIEKVVNPKYKIKSFSRIFQALRIEVNQELECLKLFLDDSLIFLKKGGRLAVISYHSLEDRIVKRFLKYWENPCICPNELPVCGCGKTPEIKILTKKAIRASSEEVSRNSRARSALLRVGEKI
jgi:16S rRNA (cytosine1402-N4)-methyltransferase